MKIITKQGEEIDFEIQEGKREPHSVQIGRNGKGEWSFEVKCYGADLQDAAIRVEEIADMLEHYVKTKG